MDSHFIGKYLYIADQPSRELLYWRQYIWLCHHKAALLLYGYVWTQLRLNEVRLFVLKFNRLLGIDVIIISVVWLTWLEIMIIDDIFRIPPNKI